MTGTSTAAAARSSRLRYRVRAGVLLGDGREVGRAPRRSSRRRRRRGARSRRPRARSCSSNSENSTIAPTPASARRRTPSRCSTSGDADATSGLRSARPMYRVESSISRSLRASAGKSLRAARGHLLVGLPALVDRLLGEPEQPLGLGRVGVRQRAEAQLAVAVVGERHPRPRRVEQERVAAGRAHHGVVADQRPVPARDRAVLLVEPVAHVDAVRDAVAVGDHQRRAVVGLGLAEGASASAAGRRPSRPARRRRCRRRSPAARGPSWASVLPAAANLATAPSGVALDICPPVFE